ncbi:MAG: hypothetical protein M3Y65_24880 [Pseudomonadota bacterium]|nr:hypothetical protein [Pseudomonadota bacterium]
MKKKITKSDMAPGSSMSAAPVLVEVTICEPHTHNGVDTQPGDIIAVPAAIAEFLVEAGAAKHL